MHRTTDGLRGSRRRDVEIAATALIRSVLDADWSAPIAGDALHERAHGDRMVLTILRARAARELSRGWTPLGQRAAATVDAALAIDAALVVAKAHATPSSRVPSQTVLGQSELAGTAA